MRKTAKLAVRKETIRLLSEHQLGAAHGGADSTVTCRVTKEPTTYNSIACPSLACPTEWCTITAEP